jgi:hypothetical protein
VTFIGDIQQGLQAEYRERGEEVRHVTGMKVEHEARGRKESSDVDGRTHGRD